MHSREGLARGEFAVIRGSCTSILSAIISIEVHAVDGVECWRLTTNRVEVMPGLHQVTIQCILSSLSLSASANVDLVFNAEAGHEYKVKKKKSFLVVVDTHTGAVVTRSESPF